MCSLANDYCRVSFLHSHIIYLCIVLCCGRKNIVLRCLSLAVYRILCVSVC